MAADHPERFGPYRVEELIGAGGMGIVYRALDEALQRHVALKTLLPALAADSEFVARFKREAQSAAALNHPNITQIYAIGQQGTIPYFAMELIRGKSLEAIAREEKALPAARATGYILQAAQGLRHAAQKKLIHRDIKPSNLMLTEEGVVKITDFGLAKAARSETQLTATGEVLGSPGYISPEQAQGSQLDARSDIYSLGATFYHLVTGRLPFEAPTPVAMIVKHMSEPLRSPRAVNPAVPYPVAAAIQKMMAKRPGERFQDYDALIRELQRALATIGGEAQGQARPAAAAAAAQPWSGTTGAEPRGRGARPPQPSPAAAEGETVRSGGVSWIPTLLAAALAVLIVAGVVKYRRAAHAAGPEARDAAASAPDASAPGDAPLQTQMTFTNRPGRAALLAGGRPGASIDDRLRGGIRQQGRADLAFMVNDHSIMPDGRLKMFGRVQNRGGATASQGRIRVRVLLDNGDIAAQGETPLDPSTIPPQGMATFELPLDYSGPVGTIKAELVWVE
ncbi:MAG TPA: serine/threonine-protein kinase [Candidatus Dormibacteraeota bacterium]|nr:serine/threonine-protein kinase [Candidatus Dormibacteraeota bacterium]